MWLVNLNNLEWNLKGPISNNFVIPVHSQLAQSKKAQQKLVLFCQKLEQKRKVEKSHEQQLRNEIEKLNSTLTEKTSQIDQLECEKARHDEEAIALRFQIQHMLDEAQLCDTKNHVLSQEKICEISQKEEELDQFAKTHQEQMEHARLAQIRLQQELKSQVEKNSELIKDMVLFYIERLLTFSENTFISEIFLKE